MDFPAPNNIFKKSSEQTKKPSQSSMIEIVLLIVIIVLFFLFIVRPKKAEVNAKNEQLTELKKQEETLAKQLSTLKALIAKLQSSKQEVVMLDEALPLEAKITRLHVLFSSLTSAAGVNLGDVSLVPQGDIIDSGNKTILANPFAASRSLRKITGSVYVFGNFAQIGAFLQKFEGNGRIMNVTAVQIAASKDDQLDLKMNFEAYFYE